MGDSLKQVHYNISGPSEGVLELRGDRLLKENTRRLLKPILTLFNLWRAV